VTVKSPSILSPVSKDPTIEEDDEPTDSNNYGDDFEDEKELGI